ncbi:hypothetical protein HK100_009787, partial [Physocladia obscura]
MTLADDEVISHNEFNKYLAMISGNSVNSASLFDNISGSTIIDLLELKKQSWKAYYEAYPGGCSKLNASTSPTGTTYSLATNPFLAFSTISSNPTRCKLITNDKAFENDVALNSLPNWIFYVPALENSGASGPLVAASMWLQGFLEPLRVNPIFNQ